jgi:molybdate transport system substrate-binding protein
MGQLKSLARCIAIALSGVALLSALGACNRSRETAPAVRVAAASDMAVVLPAVNAISGGGARESVHFQFSSSADLAEAIVQGAPYDVFFAANASFIDKVISTSACDGASRYVVGHGQLAVTWPAQAGTKAILHLRDLLALRRVAIANPAHAPFGAAAEDASARAGVLDALRPKWVFASSVQTALQYADSGNVDAAIVALSLVYKRDPATYWVVPAGSYTAPTVVGVACGNYPRGMRYLELLKTPAIQSELRAAGYL